MFGGGGGGGEESSGMGGERDDRSTVTGAARSPCGKHLQNFPRGVENALTQISIAYGITRYQKEATDKQRWYSPPSPRSIPTPASLSPPLLFPTNPPSFCVSAPR